ncbi:Transketolase [Entomophthora muscae]|uniref:Transketolase n=1 Tax=Entomophthora muscae TaxID=34485 RepID=A0ACC2UHH5_9FUNG|nr:Transketolase [Entomophthora muscae]
MFSNYAAKHPEKASEFKRRFEGRLPEGWEKHLPVFKSTDPSIATRKASSDVLNALAPHIPELVGGSADLTPSNLTFWKGASDFQHSTRGGDYAGRYFRFGVREHGMAAVMNGLSAYGGLIPFGATFLNFISYAAGASRLTAVSELQGIYIMTHDSIGLGEDGPTHQPIETLAMLRATPNTYLVRPADGNETSAAYHIGLTHRHAATVISLSRQNITMFANSSIEKALHGAYVLEDASNPQVILCATGTEVSIIHEAAKLLQSHGVAARVVSMPCMEIFEEQSLQYKESVFPAGIPVISCEAHSTFGWQAYAHASVGMKTFGASGPYQALYTKFGLTSENIANKAKALIDFYKSSNTVPAPLMRLSQI